LKKELGHEKNIRETFISKFNAAGDLEERKSGGQHEYLFGRPNERKKKRGNR